MKKTNKILLIFFILISLFLPSNIMANSNLGISIKDNEVTFKVKSNEKSMYLIGSMINWDTSKQIEMKKQDNVFSTSMSLPGGIYEYKYKPNKDNWNDSFIDPNNNYQNNGNSVLYMPGLKIDVVDEMTLNREYSINSLLFDNKGNSKKINAELSVDKKGIIISNNKIKVTNNFDGDTFKVIAKYNNFKITKEINVIKNTYKYKINYYRYDQNYKNWNLWIWENGGNGNTYEFNKGLTSDKFIQAEYEFNKSEMNFIIKKGNWESKDVSEDRKISVKSGNEVEVWLIQGDNKVYYDKKDVDLSPKILSALADQDKQIVVSTIDSIAKNKINDFKLLDKTLNKTYSLSGKLLENNKIELTSKISINPTHNYDVVSTMYKPKKVIMRKILDGNKYYYQGNDLGITFTSSINFKLWAPTATKVNLLIYDDAGKYNKQGIVENNKNYNNKYLMKKLDKGVWEYKGGNGLENKYYMYEIIQPDGKTAITVDPYAKSVSANGQRGFILNTDRSKKASNIKLKSLKPTDHIIYEMHVKDFTDSNNSGVNNPGTFKGMKQENTTLPTNKNIKTGIDHLKELGITTVHLLPSFDYASVNEMGDKGQFNWGYDPQNYNAIEGSYSTNPKNPITRMNEFKEMINTYHKNNIRVVMDVVYNHTAGIKEKSVFDNVVPGYFYRSDDNGNYTNGSGCGNEVATERKMVRKYIKDSVKYLAKEYGVDGFRFDLMGLIDTQTMKEITNELRGEVNKDILIYGEPWQAGGSVLPQNQQTLKGSQKDKGFAVFNDNLRWAIKGDSDGTQGAFATGKIGNGVEDKIITGVKGSIDDFTNRASESINYVTAHDNLNLWDKIVKTNNMEAKAGFIELQDGKLIGDDSKYSSVEDAINKKAKPYAMISEKNVLDNKLVRQDLLANSIILTSQGIPFFQAGDEFLRTKYGDHNSYKSPDIINNIDWTNKEKFIDVFKYYQGLIKLRKNHAAFRMDDRQMINNSFELIHKEDGLIAYKLKNHANGDQYKDIYVIYNGNDTSKKVDLKTQDKLNMIVNEHQAGIDTIKEYQNGDDVDVASYSMKVLYSTDTNNKLVDKKGLQVLYDKLKNINLNNYTIESSNIFKEQLSVAKKILNDKKVSQEEVDKIENELKIAYKNLKKKVVNKDELEEVVDKAYDNLNNKDNNHMEKVIEHAEKVIKNDNATQEEVNKEVAKVRDELDSYIIQTSDLSNNVLFLILFNSSILVLLVNYLRKKRI